MRNAESEIARNADNTTLAAGASQASSTQDAFASAIAVVGIGCRYPGASSPVELWENVLARRQQFRRMPDCRLPLADYHDPDRGKADKTYSSRAALIDGFIFDWIRRRVPKQTVEATDIAHWIALETAIEAIHDAGFGLDATEAPSRVSLPRERTRVVIGNSLTGEQFRASIMRLRWPYVARSLRQAARSAGWSDSQVAPLLERAETHFKGPLAHFNEDTLAGFLANTIAGRICNFLDLNGGGYTVDGACASSLLAVATACEALGRGDADLALAGGVDISLDPFELVGFAKAGALSPGDMHVYDKRAQGFIPGEGAGVIVLKRLVDAQRDGNEIYATLRGWGISSDGKGGITAPASHGQSLALQQAYRRAGYAPQTLDFIEGHGTGTPVGDRVELTGIQQTLEAFSADADTRDGLSIGVTSFKSIVGHTKAAAGVGGLIKAIAAVNQRVLPPTAGCERPSAVFAEAATQLYPLTEGKVCPPESTLRAGVSAMGFGGINCHITLESAGAPSAKLRPTAPASAWLGSTQDAETFHWSGRSWQEVVAALDALLPETSQLSLAELSDLSTHLTASSAPGPCNASVVAATPSQLAEAVTALRAQLSEAPPPLRPFEAAAPQLARLSSAEAPGWAAQVESAAQARIAFVFPGQGSQYVDCGRVLLQRFAWARALLADADRWVRESGGREISDALYPDPSEHRTDEQRDAHRKQLADTALAQPVITFCALLWLRYLREELRIEACIVAGHSLGELAALHAAGALSEEEALRIATLRGQAMAEADAGGMVAIACDAATGRRLAQAVKGYITVANINSPRQTVLSGDTDAVEEVCMLAAAEGLACKPLKVSGAFHSKHVAAAADAFAVRANLPESRPLSLRCISSVAGQAPFEQTVRIADHLSAQITSPVDFVAVAEALSREADVVLELGPGGVLCNLLRACFQGAPSAPLCLPCSNEGERTRSLNLLLAQLAALRMPEALRRHQTPRQSRPFVLPSARTFITNPCEGQLDALEIDGATEATPTSNGWFSEQHDAALVQAYQQERAAFLAQVTQLVDQDIADFAQRGQAPSLAADHKQAEAQQLPSEAAPSASGQASKQEDSGTKAPRGKQVVRELVALKTGFPLDSLEPSMRLLDDLRLDSIKTAELVVDAATKLELDVAKLDPTAYANASLTELGEALDAMASTQPAASETASTPSTERAASSQGHEARTAELSWVRAFRHIWKPSANGSSAKHPATRVLVLGEPSGHTLAKAFSDQGLRADFAPWGTSPAELAKGLPVGTTLLALSDSPASGDARSQLHELASRLQELAQAVAHAPGTFGDLLWLQNSPATHPDERGWSADAALASLFLEQVPARSMRALTLTGSSDASWVAAQLRDELQALAASEEPSFERVWIDAQHGRHLGRIQAIAEETQPRPERMQGAVALVTGGAKGITAACAQALAQETGVKLVLMGSSPIGSLREALSAFDEAGADYAYLQCKLGDRDATRAAIADIQARFGDIRMLIHGAGSNRPAKLAQSSAESALQELGPKVFGLRDILEALETAPPERVIVFGSVIGVTGMMANAWYGLANENAALALADYARRHPKTRTQTLAYSVWDEIGMGVQLGSVKALANQGIEAIPVAEGVRAFLHAATTEPTEALRIVTSRMGAIQTWKPLEAPEALQHGSRFADHAIHELPGVELLTEAEVNAARDHFLSDHLIEGTPVLPAVIALEAMAQCARRLLQSSELPAFEVRQMTFRQPITVPAEGKRRIRIHAVQPGASAGSTSSLAESIHLAVYCEADQFSRPWIRAQLRVLSAAECEAAQQVETPVADNSALSWNPVDRGVYQSMLFHGPAFQRIDAVQQLDAQGLRCRVANRMQSGFVAGDPFARDCILQSVQLAVTPDQALPSRILRWRIFSISDTALTVSSRVLWRDERSFRIESQVTDADGKLCEEVLWEAGRYTPSKPHPVALPSATQLNAGWSLDGALLQQQLRETIDGATPEHEPPIFVQHVGGLKALSTIERRARHVAYLQSVLGAETSVRWDEHGQPELSGVGGYNRLSITHEDELCVYVLGADCAGCDLVHIKGRDRATWQALLPPSAHRIFDILSREAETEAGALTWALVESCKKAQLSLTSIEMRNGASGTEFAAVKDGMRVPIKTAVTSLQGQRFAFVTTSDFAAPRVSEIRALAPHDAASESDDAADRHASSPFRLNVRS